MIRAVLDVNVLISALISPRGTPARILDAWREERFLLITSEEILSEFEQVITHDRLRRRYGITPSRAARLIQGIRQFAVITPGRLKVKGIARDAADDKFLACAVEGKADYLVTGDEDLLTLQDYEGVQILSPGIFITAL
jgi:putative PIN family toxin of toxin-antitoxin system